MGRGERDRRPPPPSDRPNRIARDDLAASITAVTSCTRCAVVGSSETGSDSPVPRLSSRITPAALFQRPDEPPVPGHLPLQVQVRDQTVDHMTRVRGTGPGHLEGNLGRQRALVARAFRARVLEQWGDAIIGGTISELIDGFAGAGHADLVPQLTFPFPVRVIARILGLPEADWPRFLALSTALIGLMRNWDRAVAAGRELRGYFGEIIADRRRNTRDDLVSQLIEAEVDGRRLDDDEIYPFLLLLLPAGAETTYRSSSNLLFGLLSQPDQLAAVRADRSLVPQAIEEALRWETPALTVARTATRDVSLGGVHIPSGGLVAVSLGAANRDPERFVLPDVFDVFREDKQHLSFGDGAHKCLGMHLARLEMRILLNAVLDRLPGLRLDPGGADVHIHGMLFRSPPNLPVRFDPALPHPPPRDPNAWFAPRRPLTPSMRSRLRSWQNVTGVITHSRCYDSGWKAQNGAAGIGRRRTFCRLAASITTPNYGCILRCCAGRLTSSPAIMCWTSAAGAGRPPVRSRGWPGPAVRSGSTSPRPPSSGPASSPGRRTCATSPSSSPTRRSGAFRGHVSTWPSAGSGRCSSMTRPRRSATSDERCARPGAW